MSLVEIRKSIRFSSEDFAELEKLCAEFGNMDISTTIRFVIKKYRALEEENIRLREANDKQLVRIRLASNGADVNVQTLLEVVNTLLWQQGVTTLRSTEDMLNPALEAAQKTVKSRIAAYKQAKDSKTNK